MALLTWRGPPVQSPAAKRPGRLVAIFRSTFTKFPSTVRPGNRSVGAMAGRRRNAQSHATVSPSTVARSTWRSPSMIQVLGFSKYVTEQPMEERNSASSRAESVYPRTTTFLPR